MSDIWPENYCVRLPDGSGSCTGRVIACLLAYSRSPSSDGEWSRAKPPAARNNSLSPGPGRLAGKVEAAGDAEGDRVGVGLGFHFQTLGALADLAEHKGKLTHWRILLRFELKNISYLTDKRRLSFLEKLVNTLKIWCGAAPFML